MGTVAHHRAQARYSLHRARDPTAGALPAGRPTAPDPAAGPPFR